MSRQTAQPRKKRILVVDDEADWNDILAAFLGGQYDVTTARDGLEGVEAASRYAPDLIISDVSMPRLNGLEMVRHLRARFGLKVPIIFISGQNAPQDIIAGISAGARHYLSKPVELADLKKRIARALEPQGFH